MASADDPANGKPRIPDGTDLTDGVGRVTGAVGDNLGDTAKAGLAGATGMAGKAASGLSGAASGVSGKAAAGLSGAASMSGKTVSGASRTLSAAGSGGGSGWRSYVPPNSRGKYPWKLRWLGLPLLFAACFLGGCMSWTGVEDKLGAATAAHLECEYPNDFDADNLDGNDMTFDFSYRDVTVDGTLPQGVTQADVTQVLENGSTDRECVQRSGIDADDHNGIVGIAVPAALGAAALAAPEPAPEPTAVPEPTATAVPEPTATPVPEPTATPEPEPEPTEVPAPVIAAIAAGAAFDGQTVTLTGEVASEEQRAELVAAAIAQVGEDNVIDELTIADGEPCETSPDRISELATVIASFGDNVTDGSAQTDCDALIYQLNSPSDAARDALDLPGSGTVEVPVAAEPAFTG